MKKRFIALFMVLMMMLQLVPATVLSEGVPEGTPAPTEVPYSGGIGSNVVSGEDYAKVTFTAYDGTELSVLNVKIGQPIGELPEVPAREGCNIIGWKTEAGEKVTEDTVVNADMKVIASYFNYAYPSLKAEYHDDKMDLLIQVPEGALPADIMPMLRSATLTDAQKEAISSAMNADPSEIGAVDISFRHMPTRQFVQPLIPVNVSITLKNKPVEPVSVVHLTSDGQAEVVASGITEQAFDFEAQSFSVYAVVSQEGAILPESRMTINFISGTKTIATMYVKNDDDAASDIEMILFDPGVGVVPANSLFKGWSLDKSEYSTSDSSGAMDIEAIRAWALSKANNDEIYEGEKHDFYAMIFQTYAVTFKDESGATLHGEALIFKPGESVTYTVNVPYTPKEQDEQFQGWYAATTSGAQVTTIDGQPIGTETAGPIVNGTTVNIPESTVFTPKAPHGYWLVFNSNTEEGTSRASYTPPQFIMEGGITEEPEEPTRLGYRFDGWFEDGASEPFHFGESITEETELFAKWTDNDQSNYTVIIWQQNVDASGYDFAEAITLSGTTKTTVNTVVQQGTGDSAYAVVNGVSKTYEGFHLKEFDQNVTITPEGNAVVNVYYDRTEYTLRFFYARSYSYNNITYVQVNVNNEGFLQGRRNNRNLNSSLTYRGNNDYALLSGSNTWKDVNNSSVSGNALNLLSSDYLSKAKATTGSITINNVTTDVVTSSTNSTARTVNMVYYYYDLKVRYGQSLDDIWPVPNIAHSSQTMTSRNRSNNNYTTVRPLLQGSWTTGNNIGGKYGQLTNDLFVLLSSQTNYVNVGTANSGNPSFTPETDVTYYRNTSGTQVYLINGRFYTRNRASNYNLYSGNVFTRNTVETRDTTAYFLTYWRYETYFQYNYNVYFSTLEGEEPTTTYKNKGYVLQNSLSYEVANGQGWGATTLTDSGYGYWDVGNVTFDGTKLVGRVDVQASGDINVYYDRYIHNIVYHDGVYVNGDNVALENKSGELLKTVSILYGQDISSYAEGGAKYYEPPTQEGYVFEGWYMDSEGKQPYTFSGTMPNKDIEVYAKWRKIQYRVLLHPNVPDDATNLKWGNQEMSFRVNEGEKIAGGNKIIGTTEEYDFIGWYTDEACTNPFEMSAVTLNDETVKTPYDQTEPTEYDARGNKTSDENRDATNHRFWITKKLDLYGKWRARIEGAKGITVVYNADSGKGIIGHFGDEQTTHTDPMTYYLDRAEANANGASVPNNPDKYKFMYWVVQRWDEASGKYVDTNTHVYPGNTFEVLKAYTREQDIPGATDPNNNKTYTLMLRAEYAENESPTPTHITWYSNNNKGETYTDNNLHINQKVPIEPANKFSFPGYEFKGWARVNEVNEDGTENTIPTEYTQYTPWLEYDNGKFYVTESTGRREVTQVAADEKLAYHGLVAVWEPKKFKVTVIKNTEDDYKTETFTFKPEFKYPGNTLLPETDVNKYRTNFSLVGDTTAANHTKVFTEVPYSTAISLQELAGENDGNARFFKTSCVVVRTTDVDGKAITPQEVYNSGTQNDTKIWSGTVNGELTITFTNKRQWGYLAVGKHFDVQNPYLDGVEMEQKWNTLTMTIQDASTNEYVKVKADTEHPKLGIYDGKVAASTANPPTINLADFQRETGTQDEHAHQYWYYIWVPAGKYHVTENQTMADGLLPGYTRETASYTADATVPADGGVRGDTTKSKGEARINNHYIGTENKVSLDILKNVTGNAPANLTANKHYTFVVRYDDLSTEGKPVYIGGGLDMNTYTTNPANANRFVIMPGQNQKVQLISNDQLVDLNGGKVVVLEGASYTVIELDSTTGTMSAWEDPNLNGYSWTNSVSSTAQPMKKTDNSVTITNNYTRDTGSLKIIKTVSGDVEKWPYTFKLQSGSQWVKGSGTAADPFTLTDTEGEAATWQVNKPASGKTNNVTIANLPTGSYTVMEQGTEETDEDTVWVEKYSLSVSFDPTSGSATVEKNQKAEVTFTNTYTPKPGRLTVTKTVVDASGGSEGQQFTFNVTVDGLPANYTAPSVATKQDGSYTFTLGNGQTITFGNLPAGASYTVTETEDDKYKTSYTVTGGTTASGNDVTTYTGTVPMDGTDTVAFTNTRKVASIQIVKNVVDQDGNSIRRSNITYSFTAAGNNNVSKTTDITISSGTGNATVILPLGTYTVTETTPASDSITGYVFKETTYTGGTGVNHNIVNLDNDEETETVTVTNHYTKLVNVYVSKTFTNSYTDDQSFTPPANFQIGYSFVVGSETKSGTWKLRQGIPSTGGDGITYNWGPIEGVPVGAALTLTETNFGITNYNVTTTAAPYCTVPTDTATGGRQTVYTVPDEDTPTVNITNTYSRDEGALTVRKTVNDARNESADKSFSFTVTLSNDVLDTYASSPNSVAVTKKTNRTLTFSLKGGEYVALSGLPVGATYTVTETPDNDYVTTLTVDGQAAEKATGLPINQTNTVAFTNTRKLGTLKVLKATNPTGIPDTQPFTVRIEKDSKYLNNDGTFSNEAVDLSVSVSSPLEINNLPIGTYNITEIIDNVPDSGDHGKVNVAGYRYDSTEAVTGAATVNNGQKTEYTITNNYTQVKPVTVEKKFVGVAESEIPSDFQIAYNYTETGKDQVSGSLTIPNDTQKKVDTENETITYTWTVTDVPVGVTFYTTESNYEITGYHRTGEASKSITVSATGDNKVAYTNTYTQGSLKIEKEWSGDDIGDDAKKLLSITVTGKDVNPAGTTDEAKNTLTITYASFTNGSYTIGNLPAGETYVVTENNYNELNSTYYEFVTNGSVTSATSAAIPADGTATVKLKNNYQVKPTSITVTKEWDDTSNQDGKRPDTTAFANSLTLYADGTVADSKYTPGISAGTGADANKYFINYSNLPVAKDGNAIVYSVSETQITDYAAPVYANTGTTVKDKALNNGTITNTHTPEKRDVVANKVWMNGTANIITNTITNAEVTFTLQRKVGQSGTYADATSVADYRKTLKVTDTASADAWTFSWNDLPRYEGGKEIYYQVVESDAKVNGTAITLPSASSAEASSYGTATGHTNPTATVSLTNTLPTTERHAVKTWNDSTDTSHRPTSITFTLSGKVNGADALSGLNGYSITPEQTAIGNDWKADWTSLPVYDDAGKPIVYDAAESAIPYYTQTGKLFDASTNTWTFTNTLGTFTLPLTGAKTMKGGETPGNYSFEMTAAAGVPMPSSAVNQKVTVSNNGTAISFGSITYTLEDMWNAANTGYDTTKTFTYTVSEVTGTNANIVYDKAVYTVTVTVSYNASTGTLSATPTYTKTVDGTTSAANDIAFENEELTSITVTKVWVDQNNLYGLRLTEDTTPTFSSKLHLMNGDTEVTGYSPVITTDTSDSNKLTITYSDIPKYENGAVIAYTVKEDEITGYTTTGSPAAINGKITNTLQTGSFTVTKSVVSDAADDKDPSKKTFSFTVTLKDHPINGQTAGEDGITFQMGTAEFTIGHGETKTVSGLPLGWEYQIAETEDPGFTTKNKTDEQDERTGANGLTTYSLTVADSSATTFTNTRKLGSLTVKKNVSSVSAEDNTRDFSFTVTLSDATIGQTTEEDQQGKTYTAVKKAGTTETPTSVTFKNGVATVVLKHNEEITINGLPTGITYTVRETALTVNGQSAYTTNNQTDSNPERTGANGMITDSITIQENGSVTTFTNTRKTAKVKVVKEVSGNMGDWNKNFDFTVAVADGNTQSATKPAAEGDDVEPAEGTELTYAGYTLEFDLKHGENQTVVELPVGSSITVTEDSTSADGYTTTINNVSSTTRTTTFVLTEATDTQGVTTVNFKNDKTIEIIDTGVPVDQMPYLLMIAAVMLLGVVSLVGYRSRKKRFE